MTHTPQRDTRRNSFPYAPVASMCVVTLRSLFLYSDPPPTLSPSFPLAQVILEPKLLPYKYPNILNQSYSSYPPDYEDGTDRVFRNIGI